MKKKKEVRIRINCRDADGGSTHLSVFDFFFLSPVLNVAVLNSQLMSALSWRILDFIRTWQNNPKKTGSDFSTLHKEG